MISAIEGGMMMPIPPETAESAAEKLQSYPARTIAGIRISPRAATSAGPEPEIPAKKTAVIIPTIPRPPGTFPTIESARSIRRFEMDECPRTIPAKIKNGMASRVNESDDPNSIWGKNSSGTREKEIMVIRLDNPSASAMGRSSNNMAANEPKRTAPISRVI